LIYYWIDYEVIIAFLLVSPGYSYAGRLTTIGLSQKDFM